MWYLYLAYMLGVIFTALYYSTKTKAEVWLIVIFSCVLYCFLLLAFVYKWLGGY